MQDDAPKYQSQANQIFGLGDNPTVHINQPNFIFNLSDDDIVPALRIAGMSRAEFEALIAKAADGTLSPDGRDRLKRIVAATNSEPEIQRAVYAVARANEADIAADDYAEWARSLRRKQRRGDPLEVAERDEPLYIPLAMKFSRQRRISAESRFEVDFTFGDIVEAVQAARGDSATEPYPALVLLGVPGGGKSTALRHLALNRLKAVLDEHGGENRVPMFVSLGDYRDRALSKLRRVRDEPDLPLTPLNFLRSHWRDWFDSDGFERALDDGRVWLILDGLNELPARDEHISDWAEFFDPHTGRFAAPNRAIVACRKADYGNWLDLPILQLELLDWQRIQDFVGARLTKMTPGAIADVLRRLQDDAKLLEVVSNPFWLDMLTRYVEGHDGHLPEGRTDLINWFVDEWLGYGRARVDLSVLSKDDRAWLKSALEPFGCWLLEQGDNPWVDWQEACEHCGTWPGHSADQALRRTEAASLLVSEGEGPERRVKFYHQLVLEYFAGRDLAQRFKSGETLARRWTIPWDKWRFVNSEWQRLSSTPTTRWEEATVFAAARPEVDFAAFVRAVLKEHPPLAARCLLEAGRDELPELKQAVIDRLLAIVERRDPLLKAVSEPSARLSLRIAAGHALGKLGDPRILEVGFRNWEGGAQTSGDVKFVEPRWCAVRAGPFQMGSNSGYDDEKPEHKYDVIKQDYAIGMFPVTNAEYDCFVKAGGYDDKDFWTPEGWAWRTQDISTAQPPGWVFWRRNWARDNLDLIRQWPERGIGQPVEVEYYEAESLKTDEALTRDWQQREMGLSRTRNPWRDDRDLNGANQPVVGACWYEALAYCKWLTFVLHAAGRIRADQEVALPNEPEWERAALPISNLQSPNSNYPWGNDFDPDRANTLDGRVLTTTPVGIYDNASPCDALDLSGNVWEWTRSRWGDDPQRPAFGYPYSKDLAERERQDTDDYRVARGGSWYVGASDARVASRFRSTPVGRSVDQGLRCVLRSIA